MTQPCDRTGTELAEQLRAGELTQQRRLQRRQICHRVQKICFGIPHTLRSQAGQQPIGILCRIRRQIQARLAQCLAKRLWPRAQALKHIGRQIDLHIEFCAIDQPLNITLTQGGKLHHVCPIKRLLTSIDQCGQFVAIGACGDQLHGEEF